MLSTPAGCCLLAVCWCCNDYTYEVEIVSLIEILESALDRELTENAAQFARIVLSYFDDEQSETVQ